MFDELETVVLKSDIKRYDLKKGDLGTVVHVYKDGKSVEVEFVRADGKTMAVITLTSEDIRKLAKNEMLHARELTATFPV